VLTGQKRWATAASDLDKTLKDIDPASGSRAKGTLYSPLTHWFGNILS
jgi:hypothetical protein